jgi:hypothetical protein
LFGAVLGLVLLPVWIVLFREQRLEGRTISSWVDDLCDGRDGTHDRAVAVFKRNGRLAVPGLIAVIENKPSKLSGWLTRRSPFSDRLPSGVRERAELRADVELLRRVWAIRMCSLIGPEARDAHRTLIAAHTDPRFGVRSWVATALAKTQVDSRVAVPILMKMMGDQDSGVRGQAAIALGLYGEAARSALPALRTMATDTNSSVQFCARVGLAMIETPDKVERTDNDGYRLRR